MKICGIIAEYNPFHSGHAYHISQARRQCSHIIVVMSGNFVQRGEPSLFDKRTRCRVALEHGADLVLELPFSYAVSGADRFAQGAISILNGLGCVDMLSFGCETDDIAALERAASLLAEEPPAYQAALRTYLDRGMPFAAARSAALESLGIPADRRPNAILAVEYLKHLKKSGSAIRPLPILRQGSGYHDSALSSGFPSATALRTLLEDGGSLPPGEPSATIHAPAVFFRDAFPYILYRLRTMTLAQLRNIPEVGEGLEYRLEQAARSHCSPDAFLQQVKSKRYAMSRIKRALIHALLGVTAEQLSLIHQQPPYARVLGIKKESLFLLSLLSQHASIPVVTRPASLEHPGLALDILAGDIYSLLAHAPARLDYTQPLLVV